MSDTSTTSETKAAPKASTRTADEPAPGQADLDANTAREDAQRQYNQDRYDARVGGKSSAEINAEEQAAKAAENPPEPGLENGGQTTPETVQPTAKKS